MFAYTQPDSSPKQSLPFVASLCLQSALLCLIATHNFSHGSGPYIPHHSAHEQTTPIYFRPEPPPPAAASITSGPTVAAATPAPAVAAKPKVEAAPKPAEAPKPPAETAQAKATEESAANDTSGDKDGETIAPFSAMSSSAVPMPGAGAFHHRMQNAMPIFTPDPPILHGEVPAPARGKDLVMEILINEDGVIAQAAVVQGIGYGVESTVVETLRRWIYVPAKINGMPIATKQQVRFHFPG